MDTATLTQFFMWCTIINGGLLVFWSAWLMLAPGLVYRTQSVFFPMPRETFNVVSYAFVAVYKMVWVVLNLVPWLALEIVG
ncbi:MAG: hypothetical protein GC159_07425 [Phycisphaera sp.]|nr:hypothetical protein [Phycisphaera sp.]